MLLTECCTVTPLALAHTEKCFLFRSFLDEGAVETPSTRPVCTFSVYTQVCVLRIGTYCMEQAAYVASLVSVST